ncbi:MAG: methylated-DNA--[protein]-cysteine S-methyltransferase [Ornithinimicrobium sp.]
MKTGCYLMDTPLGIVTIAGGEDGVSGVYFAEHRHAPPTQTLGEVLPAEDLAQWPALSEAATQLSEYFAGDRTTFDVPLAVTGTHFQQRVWAALTQIPFGQTRSYGQIATQIGATGAARAVGLANGRNPVSIIVPCHRVIGSDGSLTGYGGGSERKHALLELERERSGGSLF